MTQPPSKERIETIQDAIGYRFSDPALLIRALTHPSAVAEDTGDSHYERLEFLGDRVLGLLAAGALIERYPGTNEGGLARRLNVLVCREGCAETATALGLGDFLVLGLSEQQSGGKKKTAILANACEALMAAIYLDGGLEAARAFFERNWGSRLRQLETAPSDAKTVLQEWAQAQGYEIPTYQTIGRSGPDHRPRFSVQVAVNDLEPAQGQGANKKAAEHQAAERMLVREGIWEEKASDD